jgi:tetratricopeptide (TPR) repeat protein
VIHRDLSPSNILVDAHGQPRILDFGVARLTDADVGATTAGTDVGQIIGTLQYMAPEQTGGDPDALDTRADVYALGVIGFELLAGRHPYDLSSLQLPEAVRVIRDEEPGRLSAADRRLRGDVETIIGKALAKDRDRRYGSAAELALDIRHYLASEPIAARPPSVLYQLSRFSRRNRAFVTSVAVVSVVVVCATVALIVGQAQRAAQSQKHLQESAAQLAVLAAQKGQWQDALDNYARALDAGHPERIRLVVGRVAALEALDHPDIAKRELDELIRTVPSAATDARVLLRQGYRIWAEDQSSAIETINRAIHLKTLPPADQEFALGLVTELPVEAAAHFQKAVEIDAFHGEANAMLTMTLLLLGRLDEADERSKLWLTLNPNDPRGPMSRALLLTFRGDDTGATAALKDAQGHGLNASSRADLESVLGVIRSVRDPNKMFSGVGSLATFWRELAPVTTLAAKRQGVDAGDGVPATEDG